MHQRTHKRRSVGPLARSVGYTVEQLERRVLLSTTLTPEANWVDQGPKPLDAFSGTNATVSGAVQALALSTALPNLAYAASVNGGIWKTTDLLAAKPTWTPL